MKGRAAVLFSVMFAFLFAGVSQGEPLQKKTISVEDAGKVAAAAVAEAKKNKWNMAVAVVDESGLLVYFERMDETQF